MTADAKDLRIGDVVLVRARLSYDFGNSPTEPGVAVEDIRGRDVIDRHRLDAPAQTVPSEDAGEAQG